MGRAPCCDKTKVKRGPWSPEEDTLLKDHLHTHGTAGNWIALPRKAGLNRCGKSCRLRWMNYLRPDIKHGGFTEEEDSIIYTLYLAIGSRWSVIASKLQGRTDNDVKNYWNTKLKKKISAGKVRGFEGPSTYNAAYNTNLSGLVQPDPTRFVQVKQEQQTSSNYNDYTSLMPYFSAEKTWDPMQDSNWISRVSELSSSRCSSDDQNSHGCSASWGSAENQMSDDFWLRLLVDQSTFMAASSQLVQVETNHQLIDPVFDGPVLPNYF